jgi:hypothetical protein
VTDEDVEPGGSTRRTVLTVVVMLVVGLVLPLAGIVVAWKSCTHTAMQGRIDVAGSAAGAWRADIARCVAVPGTYAPGSGEVELGRREDNGPLIRFTMDPLDGAVLLLWPMSGDRTLEVRGRDCPALRASLTQVKNGYDGKLSGTCPLTGGGTASIEVWFRGCNE